MKKHEESRRAFLIGTAVGASAVAGAGLVPNALAQTNEQHKATGFTWPSAQAFFNTVRTHTMEGMFADPVYGGNKDFAGWVLVGFPGAQPLFSPTDLQSRDAFAGAPIIGLQAQSKTSTRRT